MTDQSNSNPSPLSHSIQLYQTHIEKIKEFWVKYGDKVSSKNIGDAVAEIERMMAQIVVPVGNSGFALLPKEIVARLLSEMKAGRLDVRKGMMSQLQILHTNFLKVVPVETKPTQFGCTFSTNGELDTFRVLSWDVEDGIRVGTPSPRSLSVFNQGVEGTAGILLMKQASKTKAMCIGDLAAEVCRLRILDEIFHANEIVPTKMKWREVICNYVPSGVSEIAVQSTLDSAFCHFDEKEALTHYRVVEAVVNLTRTSHAAVGPLAGALKVESDRVKRLFGEYSEWKERVDRFPESGLDPQFTAETRLFPIVSARLVDWKTANLSAAEKRRAMFESFVSRPREQSMRRRQSLQLEPSAGTHGLLRIWELNEGTYNNTIVRHGQRDIHDHRHGRRKSFDAGPNPLQRPMFSPTPAMGRTPGYANMGAVNMGTQNNYGDGDNTMLMNTHGRGGMFDERGGTPWNRAHGQMEVVPSAPPPATSDTRGYYY